MDEIAALQPLLLGLARLQLRNDAWAQDAVSETLVAALEGVAGFQRTAQLRTWVVGILKHKIIDQFRRAGREVAIDTQEEMDGGDALEALFDAGGHRVSAPLDWGDPEANLSRQEFFTILEACLERLPPALGRAFLLREWLEMDTPQVCKELGISATNCFVMLYRARLRLRECLEIDWIGSPADAAQHATARQ